MTMKLLCLYAVDMFNDHSPSISQPVLHMNEFF